MGVVYLGDECIGEMYTHNVVDVTTTVINTLKKPISRYMVDENGVAKLIEGDITGAFDDVVTILTFGLQHAFRSCAGLTGSVSFPNLTAIGGSALVYAFLNCTGLTGSVSFPNLTSIGGNGLQQAFEGCTGLTGSVSFPNLTTIGSYGLMDAFNGCTGLTGSVSFPNLTSVGRYGLNHAFYKCTGLTEIHFRADAQATIEAQTGYSSKFGATSATIYFDL